MELLAVILLFSLSIFKVASRLPDPLVLTSGGEEFTCTPSIDWRSKPFIPSDCTEAIEKFHTIEFEAKGNTVYEFFQAGTRQEDPKSYGQALPKQYTFGTCTLGIINMNDSSLEGLVPGMFSVVDEYATNDISTYKVVLDAAKQLYAVCTDAYDVPGYIAIGHKSSIGVFLYASNSTLEEKINATEADTRISDHLPNNWNYLGCNTAATSLPFTLNPNTWLGEPPLSPQGCANYCKYYRYFGVKAGRQ
ncbi:MAG: hypothetical protein Q9185_005735 [Variospora sp. 1 TL-2023]